MMNALERLQRRVAKLQSQLERQDSRWLKAYELTTKNAAICVAASRQRERLTKRLAGAVEAVGALGRIEKKRARLNAPPATAHEQAAN